MRPCPWLTCPRSFLVFLSREGCGQAAEVSAAPHRPPPPPNPPTAPPLLRAPRPAAPDEAPAAAPSRPQRPEPAAGLEERPSPPPSPVLTRSRPGPHPPCCRRASRNRKAAAIARAGEGTAARGELSRDFAEAPPSRLSLRGCGGGAKRSAPKRQSDGSWATGSHCSPRGCLFQ